MGDARAELGLAVIMCRGFEDLGDSWWHSICEGQKNSRLCFLVCCDSSTRLTLVAFRSVSTTASPPSAT